MYIYQTPVISQLCCLLFFAAVTPLFGQNANLNLEQVYDEASDVGSVNSILIEKDGELIAERYFGNMDDDDYVNIKSASKSIISLLVGIALDNGYLESVDQTLGDFFPDYFDANPDSVKAAITLRDLITMRAGLETTSSGNYGRWVLSDNWTLFALDQPMETATGDSMIYSTGNSHLLSVILTNETGMSTLQFAREHLFGPLGISVGGWDRDPQGYYMGGNNVALRPSDMLKIGQMVLQDGVYNGTRIVSEEWLEDSFEAYTQSNYNSYLYGYMWWLESVNGHPLRFAWGNDGQYILIFPDMDAVAVLASDITVSNSRRYQREVFDFLEETLVPFLED